MVKGFVDPHDKIDNLIKKKEKDVFVPKSETLKKIYDNIHFSETVKDNPLMLKRDYKGFVSSKNTCRVINLNSFLNLRLYPRSIYVTDKLLRLVASSRYEWLKKYISKKRAVPMNFLWIILIIFGVVIAIVVIIMLLPKFIGG